MRHFKPVMFVCLFLFLACTWDILGINYTYPSPDTIDVRLGVRVWEVEAVMENVGNLLQIPLYFKPLECRPNSR